MIAVSCHPTRINKGRGLCGPCYDKWLKTNNPVYREAQIKNTSNWFKLHPEKRTEYNIKRQEREANDPDRYLKKRNSSLKSKYGLTQSTYAQMLLKQSNGCALCNRQPGKRPLHVDHDHKTGKIRGLLCHQCNWYLGTIEADPTILARITRYLDATDLRQG